MRMLLTVAALGAAFLANAGAAAQDDFFTVMQHEMTGRANLCNSALTRQAAKEREKTKTTYKSAARLYLLIAEGMAGVRQSEAVYGKSGLSWWALRGTAKKCISYLPSEIGAQLGAVEGFPDKEYLRAEACAAALNYQLKALEQNPGSDENGAKASLEAVRGRLNAYAAVVRELRGEGASVGPGHDRGAAFLQAKYGRLHAEAGEVQDCWEVGRKILFSLPDPK